VFEYINLLHQSKKLKLQVCCWTFEDSACLDLPS